MSFSIDLRERVIDAVDNGSRVVEASKIFKVSVRVIYEWLTLRKKSGGLSPIIGYQKGHSQKITDWDEFTKFAEANQECSAVKMTLKWQEFKNITISESSIQRALNKIDYTSKKKRLVIKKRSSQNNKNLQKRLKI